MDIDLRGIHKRFGSVHANNDINLTFNEGRIIGILGENGAGKSTLMKILSGFQPADEGDILIDEQRVDYTGPLAAISHGIGMLQQDPLDVGAFTVLENFIYGSSPGFLPNRREAQKRLKDITNRFGFDLHPSTPIASLSIAQRQQLEIIRLLALGVKALILDEPTTGISAEQKETLFDALKNLAKNDGMIVLLVSHKLEDVIALWDEVAVLAGGRIVGERDLPATPAELVKMMFGEEIKPQSRAVVDLSHAPEVMRLDKLCVHSKRVQVDNLSFSLRAGEVIGFAGLDGSGQEMAMRAMAGLEHAHRGGVFINGVDLTNRPYTQFTRAGVTFCAAGRVEEGLIAGLTLTEHMALVQHTGSRIDWPAARQTMKEQIKHYDIRGKATDPIEALSGGNQQRVLMALLPEQPVALVLENPTRGLDVDSARWIWEQLLRRRNVGTGIVFGSPDLDELVAYSDRIFVFYAGQVVEVPDVRKTSVDELGRMIGGHFEEFVTEEGALHAEPA
ncbi:MAG: ATP-binding cassette domain-containing protein [Chloroflexota bacterium]